MNKDQLLQALKQRFAYVSPISFPQQQIQGISGLYIVDVLEKTSTTTATKKLVRFYIKDLNLPTEEVIFDGWDPFAKTATQADFAKEVQAYQKKLINGGIYEYIALEDINEETQRAFAWAYRVDQTGNLTEKAIIIYKDANGQLTHKEATVI